MEVLHDPHVDIDSHREKNFKEYFLILVFAKNLLFIK